MPVMGVSEPGCMMSRSVRYISHLHTDC